MRIALIGYGKMGRAIERIAVGRGHEIVLKIDLDNSQDMTCDNLSKADVAIEFTGPASAPSNLFKCAECWDQGRLWLHRLAGKIHAR